MHPTLAHIAGMYQINQSLVDKSLGLVEKSALDARPMDKANSYSFILGHITGARYEVAELLGVKEDFPYARLYNRGVEPRDPSEYPSVDKLKKHFDDISSKINARLPEITEGDLKKPAPWQPPNMENTVGGVIAFLQFHETYHVGQLAYLQRLHGGEQLVG